MTISSKNYRPTFSIKFAGKDITAVISDDIISLEYSDYLEGQSDEISVQLYNRNKKWCDSWYPEKGDALEIGLGYTNGKFVNYPDCELDTIEFDFQPDIVKLQALSTGVTKAVRTRKGELYKDITLEDLVKKIAKRNNLKVIGEMKEIQIDKVTQYMERDLEFLYRLAKLYNHSFKIVGKKLVFTDKLALADQLSTREIDYTEIIQLSIRDKLKDVVAKVEATYQNPKTKETQQKNYAQKNLKKGASSGDTLKIIGRSADDTQTGEQAQAAIAKANEDRCAGNFTCIGDATLVAGATINITNVGKLSGKYLINSSRHSFTRDGGYTTSCEIKRVFPEDELIELD